MHTPELTHALKHIEHNFSAEQIQGFYLQSAIHALFVIRYDDGGKLLTPYLKRDPQLSASDLLSPAGHLVIPSLSHSDMKLIGGQDQIRLGGLALRHRLRVGPVMDLSEPHDPAEQAIMAYMVAGLSTNVLHAVFALEDHIESTLKTSHEVARYGTKEYRLVMDELTRHGIRVLNVPDLEKPLRARIGAAVKALNSRWYWRGKFLGVA